MIKLYHKIKKTLYIIILILFSKEAYAYLDPGSTTFIIQSILAFIVGSFAVVGLYWTKFKLFIKDLFIKFKKKKQFSFLIKIMSLNIEI